MATDLASVLADTITTAPSAVVADAAVARHAAVLLADQLWCVQAAGPLERSPWDDGVVERAARQAAHGQLLDLDDVHWAMKVHPGAIVWSVITQVGDGRPGRDWLRAAVVGYAVTVRLTAAVAPEHTSRYHVTATAGALGALAAAAVLCDLDAVAVATAVRHALSLVGGSRGALNDRARTTRAVHRAHAVRTGLGALAAATTGLPAAETADVLTGGAFAHALPTTVAPTAPLAAPIEGAALLETRPRRVPLEPLDPVTDAALGVKWGIPAPAVTGLVDVITGELSGVADLSIAPLLERMARARPVQADTEERRS